MRRSLLVVAIVLLVAAARPVPIWAQAPVQTQTPGATGGTGFRHFNRQYNRGAMDFAHSRREFRDNRWRMAGRRWEGYRAARMRSHWRRMYRSQGGYGRKSGRDGRTHRFQQRYRMNGRHGGRSRSGDQSGRVI
jgi:hypothetical protein